MRKALLALVVSAAFFAAPVLAVGPSIGVATAAGAYTVDEAPALGSTSLVEGARIQTTTAPSDVHLQNGVDVRLATRSTGAVFADHVVLEQGAVRVGNFSDYTVKAGDLLVEADEPSTQAIVRINKQTVEVASLGGVVKVSDGGAMLTRVTAGSKMAFQDSGASAGKAAQPSTGAAPAPRGPGDTKTVLWVIGICAVGGLAVGLTAAAQGKNPF